MGWIEKRANGYRLVVDLGKDATGKRLRETKVVKTTSKRIAEKELVLFEASILNTGSKKTNKVRMSEFLKKWTELHIENKLELTTQTNYKYYIDKRITPFFGHKYINDIKTIEIEEFIHGMKRLRGDKSRHVGDATKVYIYRMLRSMFKDATKWYGLKQNPMELVSKPKENDSPEVNAYTEEEFHKVILAIQNEPIQFRTLITLAFTTGMRRGEILALEWNHVDLKQKTIEVKQSIPVVKDGQPYIKAPKTKGSNRIISLSDAVIYELIEYKKIWDLWKKANENDWYAGADYVFCNYLRKPHMGKPYNPKTIPEQWRNFIKVKNPHIRYIRFHDIRHTAVSILISRNVHAKVISGIVGHSKIGTTMDVYGHLMKKADVVAATVFDDIILEGKGGKKGGK